MRQTTWKYGSMERITWIPTTRSSHRVYSSDLPQYGKTKRGFANSWPVFQISPCCVLRWRNLRLFSILFLLIWRTQPSWVVILHWIILFLLTIALPSLPLILLCKKTIIKTCFIMGVSTTFWIFRKLSWKAPLIKPSSYKLLICTSAQETFQRQWPTVAMQ